MTDFIPFPSPSGNPKQIAADYFETGQQIKTVGTLTSGVHSTSAEDTATLFAAQTVSNSLVTANFSTNSTVRFDDWWFQTTSDAAIKNIKKTEFDGYFRNIDTSGFTSATTNVPGGWSAATQATIAALTDEQFESDLDELMANWLTHCKSKVDALVSEYPDDYQSKMVIVADMEFTALDTGFAKEFSTVRLRAKTGDTFDASTSSYFGDGTADSVKTINSRGSYFLQKLEEWVDAMTLEYPWAENRIQWYNLPQSLAVSQIFTTGIGTGLTVDGYETEYTDWMNRYTSVLNNSTDLERFKRLLINMRPHSDFYPPVFLTEPQRWLGYAKAFGKIGGTFVMDGNMQPDQTVPSTMWDQWETYLGGTFYSPSGVSSVWRWPTEVIRHFQEQAIGFGCNIQHFMAFRQDSLFFDNTISDSDNMLAAANLARSGFSLTASDAGTPGGPDSSGNYWGKIRNAEMIRSDGTFPELPPTP